jgi:glutathione S-transferase
MKVLGTTTSPYTRKVRIALKAASLDVPLVDTREPEGQALLSQHSSLRKVPVLVRDEGLAALPDSSLILDWLWATRGEFIRAAGFDFSPSRIEDRVALVLVEGTLDSAINHFYLKSDGVPEAGYRAKQAERVTRCLASLELRAAWTAPITHGNLSLACFLDWAEFRSAADFSAHPRLRALLAAFRGSGFGAGTEPG